MLQSAQMHLYIHTHINILGAEKYNGTSYLFFAGTMSLQQQHQQFQSIAILFKISLPYLCFSVPTLFITANLFAFHGTLVRQHFDSFAASKPVSCLHSL